MSVTEYMLHLEQNKTVFEFSFESTVPSNNSLYLKKEQVIKLSNFSKLLLVLEKTYSFFFNFMILFVSLLKPSNIDRYNSDENVCAAG